jgi:hypothetical protein
MAAFRPKGGFPPRELVDPQTDLRNNVEVLSRVSYQRQQAFSKEQFSQVTQANKFMTSIIFKGRAVLDAFKNDMEGGLLTDSRVGRILAQANYDASEIAYLHRYINEFDKLLQQVDYELGHIYASVKLTDPAQIRAEEPKLQETLAKVSKEYQSFHGIFDELIRKEDPDLLKIQGVGNTQPGWYVLVRIFAAVVAFSTAIRRVQGLRT